jgi:DnaJ-domain-containing protein 1
MLSQISTRQFVEWKAYAELEPFDEKRADFRSADVVRTLLNLFARQRGQSSYALEDCLVRFGDDATQRQKVDPKKAQAEVRQAMSILMAIHNAPVKAKARGRR